LPSIYFTVTNDLSYDQRMIRICTSLSKAGFDVSLIGRKSPHSFPLINQPFKQKRLHCFFQKGIGFYAEYNLRLFFFLFTKQMNGICAIDLDTILPCYFISVIKKIPRIYDAHELFCEMKEIVSRPGRYKYWKWIERNTVPKFTYGYTVNQLIANEFKELYNVNYEVIRSISIYVEENEPIKKEKYILYQGAVNEGRSFETLIPAMQWIDVPLLICGDGNFMQQTKALVTQYQVQQKVTFKGMLPPTELKIITSKAYIGLTLFEKNARSNYHSLANRFFDYLQSATPQICADYPVYREINNQYEVSVLINDLSPKSIAAHLNELLNNPAKWESIQRNCFIARKELNWQQEEIKLIAFYKNIFE